MFMAAVVRFLLIIYMKKSLDFSHKSMDQVTFIVKPWAW